MLRAISSFKPPRTIIPKLELGYQPSKSVLRGDLKGPGRRCLVTGPRGVGKKTWVQELSKDGWFGKDFLMFDQSIITEEKKNLIARAEDKAVIILPDADGIFPYISAAPSAREISSDIQCRLLTFHSCGGAVLFVTDYDPAARMSPMTSGMTWFDNAEFYNFYFSAPILEIKAPD
jgi:hypothetical protein